MILYDLLCPAASHVIHGLWQHRPGWCGALSLWAVFETLGAPQLRVVMTYTDGGVAVMWV